MSKRIELSWPTQTEKRSISSLASEALERAQSCIVLEAALDKSRFLAANYSIRDDLNLSDFDFRDFFVSMALKVYDIASVEGISLHPDIEKDFQDFTKRITNITEEEVVAP